MLVEGKTMVCYENEEVRSVDTKSTWRRWIATVLQSPNDIVASQTAPSVSGNAYPVEARSVVPLMTDLQKN
jgi:hypothetical protein